MKKTKLYLRIQYNASSHQIVRVDNIEEFKDVIESNEFRAFIDSIQTKAILESTSMGLKKITKPEPYSVRVPEEMFSKMNREINRKLNSIVEINFPEFNLVLSSKTSPVIKILKQ